MCRPLREAQRRTFHPSLLAQSGHSYRLNGMLQGQCFGPACRCRERHNARLAADASSGDGCGRHGRRNTRASLCLCLVILYCLVNGCHRGLPDATAHGAALASCCSPFPSRCHSWHANFPQPSVDRSKAHGARTATFCSVPYLGRLPFAIGVWVVVVFGREIGTQIGECAHLLSTMRRAVPAQVVVFDSMERLANRRHSVMVRRAVLGRVCADGLRADFDLAYSYCSLCIGPSSHSP